VYKKEIQTETLPDFHQTIATREPPEQRHTLSLLLIGLLLLMPTEVHAIEWDHLFSLFLLMLLEIQLYWRAILQGLMEPLFIIKP
jgi:hypothetical protein